MRKEEDVRRVVEKRDQKEVLLPRLNYTWACHAWFVYEGSVYALGEVSSTIFRSFVKTLQPRSWRMRGGKVGHDCLTLLASDDIEMEARWFVVCSLLDEKVAVHLYCSRNEAEEAEKKGREHGKLYPTYAQ